MKRMYVAAPVPGSVNQVFYRIVNENGEVILYQPSTVTNDESDMIALSKEDIIAVHSLLGRLISEL